MAEPTTVIGEFTSVRGALEGDEDLTVLGRVEGTIRLERTLTIEPSGVVKADVTVRNAVISGVMVGNVSASESVQLTSEGRMVGDIAAPRIIVVEGAMFRGRVDMGEAEPGSPSARKETPRPTIPPRRAAPPPRPARPRPEPAKAAEPEPEPPKPAEPGPEPAKPAPAPEPERAPRVPAGARRPAPSRVPPARTAPPAPAPRRAPEPPKPAPAKPAPAPAAPPPPKPRVAAKKRRVTVQKKH